MIKLFPYTPPTARYKPGRVPSYAQRNKEMDLAQMTSKQAKAEAQRMLTAGMSPQTLRAIDLLSTGGIFSAARLGMAERTLRKLAQRRLLERIKINRLETPEGYSNARFAFLGPGLYTLGQVGLEIATMRHDVTPPTGYPFYLPARISHDLVTNEIVLRLAEAMGERGWDVEWVGKTEAALHASGQVHALVEPDALIRFRRNGEERAFLLEYHNEERQSQAENKVKQYERAYADGDWRTAWEVETFPPVLAVCSHAIVRTGYVNAIQGRRARCVYYGKMLKSILGENVDEWFRIDINQKQSILPLNNH